MLLKVVSRCVILFLVVSLFYSFLGCTKDKDDISNINPEDSISMDTITVDTVEPWVDTTETPFYYRAPKLPFPNKGTYCSGASLPQVDATIMDQEVENFYKEWKKRYLKTFNNDSIKGNDTLKYVHYTREYTVGNAISCSEGHGFGMVITALMAGVDSTAYDDFVKLYNWYKKFPEFDTWTLMSWQQNKYGNYSGGISTATDGDLDIAYALILAHYQWGSDGKINFLEEAKSDIEAIYKADIGEDLKNIELGSWVNGGNYGKSTRFCDHMLDHLKLFEQMTGDSKWSEVIDSAYVAINQSANDSTGLLPDFAYYNDSVYEACAPNFLESDYDGYYYYNSCRAPWRIAMNYIVNGDDRANDVLNNLNRWISQSTNGDPKYIKGGYKLDGTPLNSWSDMAFVAPFGVAAMVDSEHQEWLNSMWNYMVARDISREKYFGNSIKMICLITMSGNWWVPEVQ